MEEQGASYGTAERKLGTLRDLQSIALQLHSMEKHCRANYIESAAVHTVTYNMCLALQDIA